MTWSFLGDKVREWRDNAAISAVLFPVANATRKRVLLSSF